MVHRTKFTIDLDTHAEVKAFCKVNGISMLNLVRAAVKNEIAARLGSVESNAPPPEKPPQPLQVETPPQDGPKPWERPPFWSQVVKNK